MKCPKLQSQTGQTQHLKCPVFFLFFSFFTTVRYIQAIKKKTVHTSDVTSRTFFFFQLSNCKHVLVTHKVLGKSLLLLGYSVVFVTASNLHHDQTACRPHRRNAYPYIHATWVFYRLQRDSKAHTHVHN